MHNHIVEIPRSKESGPESGSAPLSPPPQATSLAAATTNANDDDSVAVHSVRRPAANSGDMFKQALRRTHYFLEDNWKRIWVMVLWISMCIGLFTWKFLHYRRRAVFDVMGYCVCVAKGGAETLKFNMALILLPVCRNTVTWIRNHNRVSRFLPSDDNINFHKVIAVGIAISAGLHIISHLACDFPRLLHASDEAYAPLAPCFGTPRPNNYWWFVKGTEGWTGLLMLLLMAIAFVLATTSFRRGRLQLPGPLKRLPGFNAFWYSHHLFVVVYALFIAHGHFLYLTHKWYEKSTWMYLAVPMVLYAFERLTRALRSRLRPVKILEVAVYAGDVLSLHFSKPQGFQYKSGQYILVNCATVSPFQWHPFSITSSPQDNYVSVHIKTTLGDWTRKVGNVFERVCRPAREHESGLLRVDYDHDAGIMSSPSFPKVRIDGPYGAPAQYYKQYDVMLLLGLGIGVTPMTSIIKDIVNNMKRQDGDLESGAGNDTSLYPSFRTRWAYFHWATRGQESFEWFHGVMDEVAKTEDLRGVIELNNYCTSVHENEDHRAALIAQLQSLNHAKHDTRVRMHFGRPNWRNVYNRVALNHRDQRVGVFYCGDQVLTKELRELAQEFSRNTSTKFDFHKENF